MNFQLYVDGKFGVKVISQLPGAEWRRQGLGTKLGEEGPGRGIEIGISGKYYHRPVLFIFYFFLISFQSIKNS